MPDPQTLDPEQFDVLGPAIGDVESRFCARIAAVLAEHRDVTRAYLVIVSVNGADPEVVLALAFRDDHFDESVIEACTSVFQEQFNAAESLAIVPINEYLEDKFSDLRPFYAAANRS